MKMSRMMVFAALALLAGAAFASDWPQWRGPERNAISRETGLLKQWPEGGPKVVWEAPFGQAASGFAIVGGKVFTMYQDATKQYAVALDEKTGNKLWEYGMGEPYKNVATGPRATPTVDGGLVYFQDALGNVACLQAADGKEVWKLNIIEQTGAKHINWRVANSPFISGELLVLNPGAKGASIVALNKKTGATVWKSRDDVAGYSTPVEMKVGGVDTFVLLTGENVVGVAAKDGAPLWSYPWPNKSKINVPTVIVDGDKVFATTGYDVGCVLLQVAAEGGKFTAKEVWPMSKAMRCRYGNPILLDGYVYGTDDRMLACVDLKTGQKTWEQDGFGYAALSYADGMFYVMGERGNLALCRMTPQKFEKISEVNIFPLGGGGEAAAPAGGKGKGKRSRGSQIEVRWTVPTVANGRLYVRDDKRIVCLDIKEK